MIPLVKNPDVLSSLYDTVGKKPRCFKFALWYCW